MGYRIKLLPSAKTELDSIVALLFNQSPSYAISFIEEYEKQLDLLGQGIISYSLSRMPELAQLGYRTALLKDYLFLYFIENSFLVIAHFFHQKQDYARLVLSDIATDI